MHYLLILFLTIASLSFSQNGGFNVDSMQLEIDKYPNYDTAKISRMIILGTNLPDGEATIKIVMRAYKQAKTIKNYPFITESGRLLGNEYYYLGDYKRAEKYFQEAVLISREQSLPDSTLAASLLDLGITQDLLEDDEQSLKNTFEAIRILEETKDFKTLANGYLNLGSFYYYREQTDEALDYFVKARDVLFNHGKIKEDHEVISSTEANIGWCYYYLSDIESAIEKLKSAVNIDNKYNYYSPSSADHRSSLASLYAENNQFDLARIHFQDALDISEQQKYLYGIQNSYSALGDIEFTQGNYKKSAQAFLKSLEIADKLGDLRSQLSCTNKISKAYKEIGKYKLAYLFLDQSKTYGDSLTRVESKAAFEDAMTKYETEKKEAENELLQQESKLKSLQIEQERQEAKAEQERQWLVGGGIGLILLTSLLFMLNRNRLKTRTNKQLKKQRDEITEQKREITDSINYAKRIQDSFLPSEKDFESCFNEYFLMYRPKDIVAGDFYILEEVDDYIYFSVADCTGHGVPGAMVSLVCNNAIRKVLHELNERDPGKILDLSRDIVIEQFARKGHSLKDGMDLSFCRLNKKNKKLSWAGANNSLIIIRNGTGALHEIKPNKQPIGRYLSHDPFTTHEVDLHEGDQIYMTSDGYPDQFGGEKGKKYKYKRFKDLLIRVSTESLNQQKQIITSEFDDWKKGFEQIDDVCVMGVRI